MWPKGCVAGFVRRYKARIAASKAAAEGVVVETAPTIGIGRSTDGKSGVPKCAAEAEKVKHPLAADIYPDSRSLAHHARVPIAAQPWGLRRLRVVSSALLERGSQRWLTGPAGWVSPGVVKCRRERRPLGRAQSDPRARTAAETHPTESDDDGEADERELDRGVAEQGGGVGLCAEFGMSSVVFLLALLYPRQGAPRYVRHVCRARGWLSVSVWAWARGFRSSVCTITIPHR